jgi:hypothetical protein
MAATRQYDKSPEVTDIWRCKECGNCSRFTGTDAHGFGGPDNCDGSCGWDLDEDNGFCECETELTQDFTVQPDGEIDYHAFVGGGCDAEIGSYTTIECGECGAVLWTEDEAQ